MAAGGCGEGAGVEGGKRIFGTMGLMDFTLEMAGEKRANRGEQEQGRE